MKASWLASAVLMAATATGATAATTSFDSVGEFSGTQGQGGWSYGYYSRAGDASSFTTMAVFGPGFEYGSNQSGPTWWEGAPQNPWTALFSEGGHPSLQSGDHWAVRRWVSGAPGTLSISGDYQGMLFGTAAVHVLIDGVERFAAVANPNLMTFGLADLAVSQGSTIDFAISAYDGSQHGDVIRFTATGELLPTAVPEPASAALLLAGGLAGAAVRRRRTR
ncbi:PEP-CTERM sorting domain-containing protein [Azohydromonas caseinilytica]|uniref:PEP-CTERM sorting domain-containing protein n=1 Tax=Azohydromonas caseinilytica TaxID=2728836 RepID=A0A848FF72_9BURK|nr:PEP-CTERM sorting domain-containing protein [Azohydromonas caseinilytica]NML16800.1 PEP-CTERM sorting domain-containing protein [Azohydromonas caseinilytica]